MCKKCTYFGTRTTSIDTITICTRIFVSSSVSCTESTTGQTAPGVFAERLQRCDGAVWCGSVLFKRRFPAVVSVQLTEMPSELLVQMVLVPMEAVNIFKHVHFVFCTKGYQSSTKGIKVSVFIKNVTARYSKSWVHAI